MSTAMIKACNIFMTSIIVYISIFTDNISLLKISVL